MARPPLGSPVCTTPGHRCPLRRGNLVFVRSPLLATITAERTSPRTGHLSVTVRSGSILGPVGPFSYPPLRRRGEALTGSGVQVGQSATCRPGSRLPVQTGERLSWYPSILRFTRPGGRLPCRGGGGDLRCQRSERGLPAGRSHLLHTPCQLC